LFTADIGLLVGYVPTCRIVQQFSRMSTLSVHVSRLVSREQQRAQ